MIWFNIWPRLCNHNPSFPHHRVCNKSNTKDATCVAGTAYLSGSPVFTLLGFCRFRVVRSLVFCEIFCISLFVLFSLFFWPLSCLYFFDLRILITPLASSNLQVLQYIQMKGIYKTLHRKPRYNPGGFSFYGRVSSSCTSGGSLDFTCVPYIPSPY